MASREPDTNLIREGLKKASDFDEDNENPCSISGLISQSSSEIFRQQIWKDWTEGHLEVFEDDMEGRKRELVSMATGNPSFLGADIQPLESASEYQRKAEREGNDIEDLLESEFRGHKAQDILEEVVEFYLERTDELDKVKAVKKGNLSLKNGKVPIEDSYFAFVRNGKKQVRDVVFDREIRDEHLVHGSLLLNLQEEANQVRFDMPFGSNGNEKKYYIESEMVSEEDSVLSEEQAEQLKSSASIITEDFKSRLDDELTAETGLRRENLEIDEYLDKISRIERKEIVDTAVNRALDWTVLQHSTEDILRGQTEDGRRVYFDGDNYVYSVTTIKELIDFGFGENEQNWDKEHILEYTGARGTLAHWRIFRNYTDDLEGPEEYRARQQLKEFGKGSEYEGKHPMKSLQEWKDVHPEDLGLTEEGVVGYDIAEKELDWIEEKFLEVKDKLGIEKENVIEIEEKFIAETDRVEWAGQFDMVYKDPRTGEKVLLDLKTSKRLYDGHKIQTNAYRKAINELDKFDFEIDRVVIPAISPETGEARIYSDKEHPDADYITEDFYDCSIKGIEDDWFDWERYEWSRNYYQEDMWEIFARAQSTLPEPDPRKLEVKPF